MQISVLRKLDKYIGPFICNFLLFIRMFFLTVKRDGRISLQQNHKNILVVKFFGMGTIFLASPALMKLKDKYPDANITIMTLLANRECCEVLPSIDNVICINIDNFSAFIHTSFAALRNIRKREIDLVLDFEFLSKFSAMISLLTSFFSPKKLIIGFDSPIKWRNSVYDKTVSFEHNGHITKIFYKFLNCLGMNGCEVSFEAERLAMVKCAENKYLDVSVKTKDSMENNDNSSFISVNINSGVLDHNRRWPKEYYSVLIRELVKNPNTVVLLIGGRGDVDYVSGLEEELPSTQQIINLCGKSSFKQLVGILIKSKLLITNDSGPLHIAMALGIPTISFFGPETPSLYGPVSGEYHVFYKNIYCSPCLNIYNTKNSDCKNNECLKLIKPGEVLELIKSKWG